jgi:hypothetical protein
MKKENPMFTPCALLAPTTTPRGGPTSRTGRRAQSDPAVPADRTCPVTRTPPAVSTAHPASPPDLTQRPGRTGTATPPSLLRRLVGSLSGDDGMSTVEYAIGTLAAAAFAAVLYSVVSGDSIVTALTGLVERALSTTF